MTCTYRRFAAGRIMQEVWNIPREFYVQTFSAGRYRKVVRYPRSLPGDSPATRSAKHQHSAAAQQYINIRDSTEHLLWLLCCNYDHKSAAFLTLTFDDEHLPASRPAVKDIVRKMVRQLRPIFRNRNSASPVIYTVEGQPSRLPQADSSWEVAPWKDRRRWDALDEQCGDPIQDDCVRLHAHMFLLLPERGDRELVRSFWPYGQCYINYIRVNEFESFRRLAAYVTKESRNGTRPDNERAYVPSLGLDKPERAGRWCEESETIGFPRGAEPLGDGHDRDCETGFERNWIMYRFPRSAELPKPYVSKGRISQRRKPAKKK